MIKFNAVLIQKTVFFMFDGSPAGFIKLHFRKRKIVTSMLQILRRARKAKALFLKLPKIAKYASILSDAKDNAYRNRADSERVENSLDSLIRRCIEVNDQCTIVQAIDLLLNGKGISDTTGKNLKPITCIEKRRKTFAHFIVSLQKQFGR